MFLKSKVKFFFFFLLYIIAFCKLDILRAQVCNNQDLYVSDNSVFFVGTENFNFGLGSITTSRTKLEYGVLSFSDEATSMGADRNHYVDGYAQTLSQKSFILPIGQSDFYAPIQVTPSNSDGVDAAYFRAAPSSVGILLDKSILSISSVEYWDIRSAGEGAEISLSWGSSSAISELTSSSLANLTIVGWNGLSWVAIPSIVEEISILGDVSSLDSGSISSNAVVNLKDYSAFSLGSIDPKTLISKVDKIKVVAYSNLNRLFIESSRPITSLTIYDMMGKKIVEQHLKGEYKYDEPFNYPKSIYIAEIELENGVSLFTKKIIN